MTLITKLKIRRLLSLFIAGSFFTMQSGWTEQTETQQKEEKERWFEIEVILYKANSEAGLSNESWSGDTQLTIPSQIIDFLRPFSGPERLTIEETDLIAQNLTVDPQNEVPELNTPDLNALDLNSSDPERTDQLASVNESPKNVASSAGLEKPFLPLNEKDLRLTSEANRIGKNNNYSLVAHFSWRQPVFDRKNSQPVRIAGGFDYQETFEYSGSKKVDPAYIDPQTSVERALMQEYVLAQGSEQNSEQSKNYIEPPTSPDSAQKANNKTQLNADLVALEASSSSTDRNQGEPNLQTKTEFVPVPLPWVPEVDGSMRVYIQRNYLHIDTNLFYRLPFKEEVSALDLTNTVISFEGGLSGFASSDEEVARIMPENTLIDASKTGATLTEDLDQTHRPTWRLDNDFLARKTEKIYITRLFNYPLKQTRRLRSGELHYFDHPLIGMLVMIRPYDPYLEQNLENSEDAPLKQKDLGSVSPLHQSSDTIPRNKISVGSNGEGSRKSNLSKRGLSHDS